MEQRINDDSNETYSTKSLADISDVEEEGVDPLALLMDKPFDPTRINIETKTPSLDTLIRRIQRNTVQLNTESYFQRSDDLWDKQKQSRLIESILIQFPLPAFFFDASDDNNWLVVDGLQRLSSVRNFIVKKSLKLTNLEFLTQLNGKGWDDIDEDLQRIIEEAQVVIYKIMPGTPTDVKFNIFKRINTGGLVLEPQEIRHALFQGRPADFIAKMAKAPEFIAATNKKVKSHRMLDRDFANRFLCFYLYGYKDYVPDLDTYMSKAMASIEEKSETELEKILSDFKKSLVLARHIFKESAFRKITEINQRLPPINKALFDAISVQFAKLNESDQEKLKDNGEKFKLLLMNTLANDGMFFTSISSSTGDKNRVYYRHSIIENLIHNAISND